ncbi:histidine kinase osmosensor [Mortierella alpina]|uniref:Histidine kinase osmosensor n=1 Tax=Mortierella alpina TaxID=64518 RepID=A0A9P6LXF4_MORAP|nr:histidine kinase osmosensor [Mortierella alpina]
MFYYLLTSHATLLPEEMTPGSITEGLNTMATGYGTSTAATGACLPGTYARVAGVIQRMVAKSYKDRFLSMIQIRKELSLIRDHEQEALKEAETKVSPKGYPDPWSSNPSATRSTTHTVPTPSSSYTSSIIPRSSSPANSMHSLKSTSTLASQEPEANSQTTRRPTMSTHNFENLSFEDRAFVLESVLSLSQITNLQEMLHAISHALDNILAGHPPEEMAIILWKKDEHAPNGGTWAIMEDKFRPGTKQATLTWTDLSERRDHMPVLVRKALDTQEPVFSTAVGSRSQLPTIACVPILTTLMQSGSNGVTVPSTLVGALYLHHLHPRFYFTKRDQDLLMLFCQKLANPLLHCEKIAGVEKQLSLATQRNRFLEDTIARIQKNEHEVFSWMEALPCFVWVAERDDVISRRYLSRSWFDFTGLPGDNRTGDRWISAMHPDDVAGFQKEVSQSYKTGVYKDCEFRLMRYDGVYRWHLSRAIPVLNHSGAILKWVGVTIDIDDLYLAQKAELHKKSNFLANMSHELRTPFSGFHGMLTLLGYSELDEEQKEFVYTAKASCEKLLLIIDDLLDFSKLEADKVTLEASPFDLEEVFDEVEDIVEPLASQKSLELAFIKADNVPEVLVGDCNRLKQILLNLVGNAIKFTHSGHVIVRCKVLDRESDMSTVSKGSSMEECIDDDKFYFRHEKNGGGQCQSEMRPPNSGRFSSPEPLSENSIKLMFSVEDTGIGISLEEQEVLFSPFSQVDGSATRSYGGSGLGLSICLQLVKLMKGRIGLVSQREKGSTFWFVIQCEQNMAIESPLRTTAEAEVVDSTKEIKRITRTLGTPRILIASTSETTISTLQAYLSDFNTEVANLPSTASSRLEESVANGIRFDFVCWDFPAHDPQHTIMLDLQARPNLNNVHFVLLYTPSTDIIRRAQSLQLPPSYSTPSSGSPLGGGRKRPMLSQSVSLRLDHSGSGGGANGSAGLVAQSEVPGLSPEKLNSLRITCISKPLRRLKLLRAFVEILDDSAKIHDAHKGVVCSGSTAAAPSSPTVSMTPKSASSTAGSPLSPTPSSPAHSLGSPVLLSPIGMTRSASTSVVSTLEGALLAKEAANSKEKEQTLTTRPELFSVDSATHLLTTPQEQKSITQSFAEAGMLTLTLDPPPLEISFPGTYVTPTAADGGNVDKTTQDAMELEEVLVIERGMTPVTPIAEQERMSLSESPAPLPTTGVEPEPATHAVNGAQETGDNVDAMEKKIEKEKATGKTTFKKKSLSNSTARNGKLRSNSPKPGKTSKLVTEEATEFSLSHEEAKRIEGMRILLAEDNLIAQKVLSKQLAIFGLVISCANDGADALALFKAHPRGYYTMGFFDHHMPNCDGVRATQQIRALEKEHAAEVKGPVPRLPIVAVSADIQETARKACLNSGMERYVTKPLMQKDLVAMVRNYCVLGDAEASTQSYDPPPEGAVMAGSLGSAESVVITSTVEAMVSAGHVSAPIGCSHSKLGPLQSCTSSSTLECGAVGGGGADKTPALKRELELSPAALRGLALIRENTLQDESSRVGGGGSIKPAVSVGGFSTLGSQPMQYSSSHSGFKSYGSQSQLRSAPLSMGKSSSSTSLSASYFGQGHDHGLLSSPLIVTSSPVFDSPPSHAALTLSPSEDGGSTLSPSMSRPIAAMAAGAAAAAVAVASAAVNSMSSAINEHIIHPPSIYAAQGLSASAVSANGSSGHSSSNSNGGRFCSSFKNIVSGGQEDTQRQYQKQQQQQQQQEQHDQLQLQLQQLQQQQQQQQQHIQHVQYVQLQQQLQHLQPDQALEHAFQPPQEVFATYLHPCEPSPTVEREQDATLLHSSSGDFVNSTSSSSGSSGSSSTACNAGGVLTTPPVSAALSPPTTSVATAIVSTNPLQVGSWM